MLAIKWLLFQGIPLEKDCIVIAVTGTSFSLR
jgi:hypothetical protein